MTTEASTVSDGHWFDLPYRQLVRNSPRRAILCAAVALAAKLLHGGASEVEAGTNKKRCGRSRCAEQWPGDSKEAMANRATCETTCRRCARTRTAFCILEGDPNDPAKVADCCPRGKWCCKSRKVCCLDGDKCCLDPGIT